MGSPSQGGYRREGSGQRVDLCPRWFLGRAPPLLLLCCRVAAGRVHSGRVWAAGQLAGGADALLPLPFLLQGVPFPQNEANAMDVVVQFAVHRLGFQPQDIILYAWSIGGFTGTSLPPPHTVRSFSSPSPKGSGRSRVEP